MKRRVLAALIDFWFSVAVISDINARIPLWLEVVRTRHFVWQFQRQHSVNSDQIAAFTGLVAVALVAFYYVFPLTRGRQTVGDFILGLRVAPPFGDDGRFTFKAALIRTLYAFIGLGSWFTRSWDHDEEGRTWYDRETNCTVRLVSDD